MDTYNKDQNKNNTELLQLNTEEETFVGDFLTVYYDFLCPLILGAAFLSCAKLLFSNLRQIRFSSVSLTLLVFVFLIPVWNGYIHLTSLPPQLLFGRSAILSFWLIGPLFYLFILHNTKVLRPTWRDSIHALPYLLVVLLESNANIALSFPVLLVVWNLLTTTYLILSLKCLHKAKQQRKKYLSQELSLLYRWGMAFLFGVFAFIIADVVISGFIIANSNIPHIAIVMLEYFRLLSVLLLVGTFEFGGLQYHNPASDFSSDNKENHEKKDSRLSDSMAIALQDSLERCMAEQLLFKQADLSLLKLSESMNVSPHYLSALLNTHMKVNFYDYINQMRIEDAKKQLSKEPNMMIVDIAMNSGFSSKSTFYNCFKKYCDMTPTQYRNRLMKTATV